MGTTIHFIMNHVSMPGADYEVSMSEQARQQLMSLFSQICSELEGATRQPASLHISSAVLMSTYRLKPNDNCASLNLIVFLSFYRQ